MNKIKNKNFQENIIPLKIEDKHRALNTEELNDIEGPADNDPLIVAEFLKVSDKLRKNGVEVISDREQLSSSIFGPIYKFEAREIISDKKITIVERCFGEVQDIERRFSSFKIDSLWQKDSEARYEIINKQNQEENRLIIDYLYNEEQALKNLQGIKGIPKFYGAVYDGLNGSILEEYVDGPDLSMLLLKNEEDRQEWDIMAILEQIKNTYKQAAEYGYIHNDSSHATIMLSQKQEAYLADWYLYSQGNIQEEGPIKDKYLQGLKDLEDLEKDLLIENN